MFGNSIRKQKAIVDPQKIERLISRGVENIYPNKEFLKDKLLKGEQITIYAGFDPTSPNLHLGHAIQLRKLREFQNLGHKIIMLIGDFTGMIGDPTDKSATRKRLTKEEVLNNCKNYKDQASHFINFSGQNKAEIKFNSKWLGKLSFGDVLELSSVVTVDQMLKRDMFENRMKEGKPIYIHEFMYPLMQGYDSIAMDVDGELGGNDQTFNMLMGRDLMKVLKNKEKFVLTLKLLTDSSGKKMGKTENNSVNIGESAKEIFGKVMSWSDNIILPGMEICTDIDMLEIEKARQAIEAGANPRDYKAILAKEIIKLIHGEKEAIKAEEGFINTFRKGDMPEDTSEVSVPSGTLIADILIKENLVKSKTEWRRLVDEKAVTTLDGEEIKDYYFKADKNLKLKIGKKRFIKINII